MQTEKTVLYFLTQNEHKFLEAKKALSAFPVALERLDEPKRENKDDSLPDPLKEIALSAAVRAAKEHQKIVIAEDSGVFFEAYDGFPGLNTKWIFRHLGYRDILLLLSDKEDRRAYFRTVAALALPDGRAKCFEGIVRGSIADRVYGEEVDCMDYDRIFIPEGSELPFALMMDRKRVTSHRFLAFCEIGRFVAAGGLSKMQP